MCVKNLQGITVLKNRCCENFVAISNSIKSTLVAISCFLLLQETTCAHYASIRQIFSTPWRVFL